MSRPTFEGSLILEKLTELGLIDDFFEAIDSDNFSKVQSLLESAGFDSGTISIVLEKMEHQDDH